VGFKRSKADAKRQAGSPGRLPPIVGRVVRNSPGATVGPMVDHYQLPRAKININRPGVLFSLLRFVIHLSTPRCVWSYTPALILGSFSVPQSEPSFRQVETLRQVVQTFERFMRNSTKELASSSFTVPSLPTVDISPYVLGGHLLPCYSLGMPVL